MSYNDKHNEANVEDNRDGADAQPQLELRRRRADGRPGDHRAARAAEAQLARDAALLAGRADAASRGDEIGRTQRGNNNAYCQDNEITWLDWDLTRRTARCSNSPGELIALRNAHPLFRRRTYFRGRAVRDPAVKDIIWLNPDGAEMSDEDWSAGLGALPRRAHLRPRAERARRARPPVEDDDLLLLLNATTTASRSRCRAEGERWDALLDTGHAGFEGKRYGPARPTRSRRARSRCSSNPTGETQLEADG